MLKFSSDLHTPAQNPPHNKRALNATGGRNSASSEPRDACNRCGHVDALIPRGVARVGGLLVERLELGAQLVLARDLAQLRLLELGPLRVGVGVG